MAQWSQANDMKLNEVKTKEMIITFSHQKPDFREIIINNTAIKRNDSFKILGIILQNDLKWNQHVNSVISKANKRLYLLGHLKKAGIPTHDLLVLYNFLVVPVFNYACEVYHSWNESRRGQYAVS